MALYIKWPRFDEERIDRGLPEQGTGYAHHFMKFTCMYNMYMSGEFRLHKTDIFHLVIIPHPTPRNDKSLVKSHKSSPFLLVPSIWDNQQSNIN